MLSMRLLIILTIFCMVIGSSITYAVCLSDNEISEINNISVSTNTSNTTLINLFERICSYNESIHLVNDTLTNVTFNITNMSINITNITEYISNFTNNTNMSISNLTSYINNWTNVTNANIKNITIEQFNQTIENMTREELEDFWTTKVLPIQDMIEETQRDIINVTNQIRNDTLSEISFNDTMKIVNGSIASGDASNSLELSNKLLPIYIGLLILGIVFVSNLFKHKYPQNISKRFIELKGIRKIPQELSSMDSELTRETIQEMRDYISGKEQYSATTRAQVLLLYQDKQIDTKSDVDKHLESLEPKVINKEKQVKKVVKSAKKTVKEVQEPAD